MKNESLCLSTLFHGLSQFLCTALPHVDQKRLWAHFGATDTPMLSFSEINSQNVADL